MADANVYPPSAEFVQQANVKGMEGYRALYQRAAENPEEFWGELAEQELHWFQKWTHVFEWNPPFAKWFPGGKINASYNCVDRHLTTARKNKVAILWEGEPGDQRMISYQELHRLVCRFANVLKARGLKAGDRAIVDMGMVPELPVALLACARLGITHSVVFGGEAAEHHAVGDAESRAGQQGDGQFRDHAHVDDGAVAGLEAAGLQHVGETADQAVQLLVGDHALVARFAFPQDGDFVLPRGGEVAVNAVIGGVDLAAGEPFGEGRIPLENVGPLLKPVQLLFGQFAPKLLGIFGGSLVKGAIALHPLHGRLLDEFRRRRVDVCVGHAGILSECDYGPSRRLAAAPAVEQRGGFVEGVGVHVRAQDAIASESEDGGQVVARAQIAAADGDALQNRIDQGKFVRSDGQAHQDERAVAAQQAEGLRDGGWRGREDNRGIHVAQRAGIRAGGAGEGQLFFRGIGNRRAQSLVERDLERQVAEAAVAEEGHRLAGGEGSFAERSVGGPTGAVERRSIGGGKMGGNTDQGGGWRQRVVDERALQGIAEVGLFRTETLAAGGAPLPGSAGCAQKGDA